MTEKTAPSTNPTQNRILRRIVVLMLVGSALRFVHGRFEDRKREEETAAGLAFSRDLPKTDSLTVGDAGIRWNEKELRLGTARSEWEQVLGGSGRSSEEGGVNRVTWDDVGFVIQLDPGDRATVTSFSVALSAPDPARPKPAWKPAASYVGTFILDGSFLRANVPASQFDEHGRFKKVGDVHRRDLDKNVPPVSLLLSVFPGTDRIDEFSMVLAPN